MGTYDTYKVDSDLESKGAWVTMGDGSSWQLRRLSSKIGRAAYQRAQGPHAGMVRRMNNENKPIPAEIDQQITRNTLINGIVIGWKGVTGEDGSELTFGKDALIKVLTDLPDLATEVMIAATNISNFQAQVDQDAAKNSDAG